MNYEVESILNKLNTLMFTKWLPKQKVFKEDNGEPSEVPYRLGRLDGELYKNRKVINTMYGEEEFIPEIKIYISIITEVKGYMLINILNAETKSCAKQILVKTQPNEMTITDLNALYSEVVYLLEDDTKTVIDLIELLRSKDIAIEEYC